MQVPQASPNTLPPAGIQETETGSTRQGSRAVLEPHQLTEFLLSPSCTLRLPRQQGLPPGRSERSLRPALTFPPLGKR